MEYVHVCVDEATRLASLGMGLLVCTRFLPRENPASQPEMTVNARKPSASNMQVRPNYRGVHAGQRSALARFLNGV